MWRGHSGDGDITELLKDHLRADSVRPRPKAVLPHITRAAQRGEDMDGYLSSPKLAVKPMGRFSGAGRDINSRIAERMALMASSWC